MSTATLTSKGQITVPCNVDDLLGTPQCHLERRDVVQAAVRRMRGGRGVKAGLVDALIAETAKAEGCSRTVSFDKLAVRSAGMTLLRRA